MAGGAGVPGGSGAPGARGARGGAGGAVRNGVPSRSDQSAPSSIRQALRGRPPSVTLIVCRCPLRSATIGTTCSGRARSRRRCNPPEPVIGSPSNETITSPAFSPPLAAGPPSATCSIITPSSSPRPSAVRTGSLRSER